MSVRTEKKLLDFGKWWEWHTKKKNDDNKLVRKLPEDIDKRTELLGDAIDSLAHIYIDIVEDIKILEGRGPVGGSMSKIITPDNVLKRN